MSTISGVYRAGFNHSIQSQLDSIKSDISQIYTDIAEGHYESAEKLIRGNESISKHTLSQVSYHLNDAHTFFKMKANKKKDIKFFGIISLGEGYYCEESERFFLYLQAIKCGLLIMRISKNIEDFGVLSVWKETISSDVSQLCRIEVPSLFVPSEVNVNQTSETFEKNHLVNYTRLDDLGKRFAMRFEANKIMFLALRKDQSYVHYKKDIRTYEMSDDDLSTNKLTDKFYRDCISELHGF